MSARHEIQRLLAAAVERARADGWLPPVAADDLAVERPQTPEHGDFASSLPLKLARSMHTAPMAIAERLAVLIAPGGAVASVSVAPPGFLNFTLDPRWLARQVAVVLAAGDAYGNVDVGGGERVQVEFVSVNPTGPIHVGHARGAVIGGTLADILAAAGYVVQREYYLNDAGTQMDLFHQTLYARYRQALGREAQVPPGGYQGAYMADLAERVRAVHGDRFLRADTPDPVAALAEVALPMVVEWIRTDLQALRVWFDVWFSERSLYDDDTYRRAMTLLRERGYVAERDGATWFTSTDLGEEKDNVLVRSNGLPTYFASDVAYHYDKFLVRGFHKVIDVWGADHQGHVSRMKAVVRALGVDPDRAVLIIAQMVSFRRGGEAVRLSKRTGEMITLRDLVDEVGPDACRFFFLSRAPQSQMEFDMELAVRESAENPVYYVQYAHARIAGILALARERGIEHRDGDLSLLTHEAELALVRRMLELPDLVENMARRLEPHHLPHYAIELATAFHWFYQQCRVVSAAPEDLEVTRARLRLVDAARVVLARCLGLMSMAAPDRM